MLEPEQLRAARALLDYSREQMAQAAGLSPETIKSLEGGNKRPLSSTVEAIYKALEDRNIELLSDCGVRFRNDTVRLIEGSHIFVRVLDDVYLTLKDTQGEVLFSCVVDKISPPEVVENYRRIRRANIKMRSLIDEKDTYLMGNLDEYRCIPSAFFHNNPQVIYGDKVATMILGNTESAIIIRNRSIAEAHRNLFNLIWPQHKRPEMSDATERYEID
ncbi:MAG: helix-turn-helix domain-containing protein [Alphaproteobacteria bacterium]|nr:MAG: helix-turn-helix domain-containing protein [Alphaproteobacteria bacterium]